MIRTGRRAAGRRVGRRPTGRRWPPRRLPVPRPSPRPVARGGGQRPVVPRRVRRRRDPPARLGGNAGKTRLRSRPPSTDSSRTLAGKSRWRRDPSSRGGRRSWALNWRRIQLPSGYPTVSWSSRRTRPPGRLSCACWPPSLCGGSTPNSVTAPSAGSESADQPSRHDGPVSGGCEAVRALATPTGDAPAVCGCGWVPSQVK